MHAMYDRMSLLAYVNDRETSRNRDFARYYFRNAMVQDFLAGQITGFPDPVYSEDNPQLFKAYQKIRESLSKTDLSIYTDEIARILSSGTHLIPYDSDQYPPQLKDLADPPLLLYHRGTLMDFQNCIAIIGTRTPSEYGKQFARQLSSSFVKAGYTIVSGLASGIDTEAHRGALDAGGKTIAILAGHIDDIYPRSNASLAREIIRSGAILSEVSAFVKTHKGRFISRNRLTSGLSRCVIAVESHGGGGTLRQVTTARSQGRPVFVCRPEDGDTESAKGFDELCRRGVIPISSADDVIRYLGQSPAAASGNGGKKQPATARLDQFL
jgi:DNA processing protein